MLTSFITTARLIFVVAAVAASVSRLASTGAPETQVHENVAARIVFIPEPAPAADASPGDVPRIVVTAKRMSPDEKAAYDAEQEAVPLAARQ